MSKVLHRMTARLQEFGITNGHLTTSARLPPVFLNSLPKSGTNMISRLMYISGIYRRAISRTVGDDVTAATLRGVRRNSYLIAHSGYSKRLRADISAAGMKHLLIVRNPISVAVSNVHYLTNPKTRHRLQSYFSSTLRTHEERLRAVLTGVPKERFGGDHDSLPLIDHYRKFADWAHDPNCLILRFEDLVGAAGGGSDAEQGRALHKIQGHIGMPAGFSFPAERLFSSSSRTFRSGKAYDVSEQEQAIFDEIKDPNWEHILETIGYRQAPELAQSPG